MRENTPDNPDSRLKIQFRADRYIAVEFEKRAEMKPSPNQIAKKALTRYFRSLESAESRMRITEDEKQALAAALRNYPQLIPDREAMLILVESQAGPHLSRLRKLVLELSMFGLCLLVEIAERINGPLPKLEPRYRRGGRRLD